MADLLDILGIADSLDEINGENIGSEERDYGMHYTYLYIGMSGEKFIDKMNANFHATDAQFLAHHDALNIRIISNQIKEIKVENGNTFYTLDGPEVPEEDREWHTLQGEWGKIGGNLADQTDLLNALNLKANQTDFVILQRAVQDNYTEFQGLVEDVSGIANDLAVIDNQINNNSTGILVRLSTAEALLAKKISSDQVIEIRTTDGLSLEFTTDGHTWKPVSTAGVVEWGDIIGDIENQADLLLRFSNLNDAIDTANRALSDHEDNHTNPHQVTAAQVGLGNVDNTSDTNKPLSTAQKQYVDTQVGGLRTDLETEIQTVATSVSNLKMKNMTQSEYTNLQNKDSGTLYFINDM